MERVVSEKLKKQGFQAATPIQIKSLPVIARKINCLLVAPTGSGKTEAAVIPVFSMLSNAITSGSRKGKIRVVYVTPLRALNNDVLRRILKYAQDEDLRVEIRHGDTNTKTRKRIANDPPEILITTPESLGVILANQKMLFALQGLEWVIIDEVHELISTERGAHLSLSLERLHSVSLKAITRIGLSATLSSLYETSKFVAGPKRNCAILVDNSIRNYDIDIKFVDGSLNEVATFIKHYIKANNIAGSVLLFTNTRDEAEYLGAILKNRDETTVEVHHGSLSRDMREETENKLRCGLAGIVVCTSSLELGLDIGSVELVVHYGSPRQVSKLIQRIGRSRHRQFRSAKGLIVTNNSDDEIEALAITGRMKRRSIEEQVIHREPLDVLAHHLVGLSMQENNPIKLESAFEIFGKAYPFSTLNYQDMIGVVELLHGQGIVRYDQASQSYRRTIRAYKYYFENLSMIPEVLKFEVVDMINNRRIGSLDQEFVGDYGERGNVFVLKGSQWRIISVDEVKMRVNVEPLHGAAINVPYWNGELIPVDYETAREVGIIRNQAAKNMLRLSSNVIDQTLKVLYPIPDSYNVVVESSISKNTLVIHSTFGTKVNNTIASLMSTILSSQLGYVVETRADSYRIVLTSSARIGKGLVEAFFTDSFDLEAVLIASMTGTHNINRKVWTVSKRFGIVNKDVIYDKRIARLIYDRYSKTPVSKESIRELIHDKYDMNRTRDIFKMFKKKIINLHWKEINEFSELAKPILEHFTKFSANPLSIEKGIIELIKERLDKTKHRLICVRCGRWDRIVQTKDASERLSCPLCHSRLVTSTSGFDNELDKIIIKKLAGEQLSSDENHKFSRAWKVASLINNFGRRALIVLAGYGIGADTAARILRNYDEESELYRAIYEAERQYVMTRGFWKG
ncbi:MAG TPA: DEAD/DEAH box helicase [Nitrososphaeraceae archaeon]|nr:DEAD/DEAH box helicase [Nitrososphaeraceae archaeon]